MLDHAPRINAKQERRRQIVAVLIALAIATAILASTAQSNAEPQRDIEPDYRRELARMETLLAHCLQGGRIGLGDGAVMSCKVSKVRP